MLFCFRLESLQKRENSCHPYSEVQIAVHFELLSRWLALALSKLGTSFPGTINKIINYSMNGRDLICA